MVDVSYLSDLQTDPSQASSARAGKDFLRGASWEVAARWSSGMPEIAEDCPTVGGAVRQD